MTLFLIDPFPRFVAATTVLRWCGVFVFLFFASFSGLRCASPA